MFKSIFIFRTLTPTIGNPMPIVVDKKPGEATMRRITMADMSDPKEKDLGSKKCICFCLCLSIVVFIILLFVYEAIPWSTDTPWASGYAV